MKITKNLPQFGGQVALIAATSKNRAEMHIATEGIISKARDVKADFPKYTDREGFFARSGRGRTYGTGSVYEKKREKMEQAFVPEFIRALDEMFATYRITDFYLLAPAFQNQYLLKAIPKKYSRLLRLRLPRNLYGRHPFALIREIQEALAKPLPKPLSKTQVKLLKKPKTKNKIKGKKMPKIA